MKKSHLFLLTLSAFALMACGGNSATSSVAPTSSTPVSQSSSVAQSSTPASSVTSSQAASSEAASSSEEVSSEAASSSEDVSSEVVSSEADSSVEEESSSPEAEPFTATFTHDENVSIYVYPSADYTATPTLSDTAIAVDSDTGATLSDGNGQINFKVELAEGYAIDAITVDGTYKNLKGPDDTGVENVYRITKISSDLTVTITTRSEAEEATGYEVTFTCDEHVKVGVYMTSDYTLDYTETNTAYSRDGDTGDLLKDGNGQVNFKLIVDDGYTPSIAIAESTYKNLKGPDDTGVDNVYRITKITGDLTVTVTTTANA